MEGPSSSRRPNHHTTADRVGGRGLAAPLGGDAPCASDKTQDPDTTLDAPPVRANKSSASALRGTYPSSSSRALGGVHRTRRSACDPPRVSASPSVGCSSARRRSVLARLRKTFRFQSGRGVWIRLEADDEVIAECECCSAVVLSLDDRIILVDGPPLHRPDRDSGVTCNPADRRTAAPRTTASRQ